MDVLKPKEVLQQEAEKPARVECANCEWTGTDLDVDLADVEDLFERIDPGSEVPAGECPKCGVLAYIVDEDNVYAAGEQKIKAQRDALLEVVRLYLEFAPDQPENLSAMARYAIANRGGQNMSDTLKPLLPHTQKELVAAAKCSRAIAKAKGNL